MMHPSTHKSDAINKIKYAEFGCKKISTLVLTPELVIKGTAFVIAACSTLTF